MLHNTWDIQFQQSPEHIKSITLSFKQEQFSLHTIFLNFEYIF